MRSDKALFMLGIAARAKRIASGEYQTEQAVKSGTAHLVIVAEDASDNTKKMFRNMCANYGVKLLLFGNRESLGHSIGKSFRASLAVTDEDLAEAVSEKLAAITTE